MHAVEDRAQVFALHQFHRKEDVVLLVNAKFVGWNDSGMIELPRDLRLFQKAAE